MKRIAKLFRTKEYQVTDILLAAKNQSGDTILLAIVGNNSYMVVSANIVNRLVVGFFNRRTFDLLNEAKAEFINRLSATNL